MFYTFEGVSMSRKMFPMYPDGIFVFLCIDLGKIHSTISVLTFLKGSIYNNLRLPDQHVSSYFNFAVSDVSDYYLFNKVKPVKLR